MVKESFFTLCSLGLAVGLKAQEVKPNIVFFLADDLGWTDLGFMGSDYYESPNLDALAQNSLSFTQAYSAAPNSAPSRACLMTGKYTPRHGVYTVESSERGDRTQRKLIPIPNTIDVRGDFVTMSEMLSRNGYSCGHVGKWHLGLDGEGTGPLDQGFISNVAGCRVGHPFSYFYPYGNKKGCHEDLVADGHAGEYLTDRLTDEGIKFIREHKDEPFFLYMSQHAVHTPLQAPPELLEKYKVKPKGKRHNNPAYAAIIENMDANLGKMLAALDEMGLSKNTLFVFFSDNGGLEPVTDNWPLQGGKGMAYEGGTRVPLLIRWPGHVEPGVTDALVCGLDFYPTFAKVAGENPAKDLDGEDIFEIVDGKKRDIFWHFPAYLQGTIKGGPKFRATPYSSVRSGDWKLIYFYEDDSAELYNIAEDISEAHNLILQEPQIAKKLRKKLFKWIKKTRAPIPIELNPYYKSIN